MVENLVPLYGCAALTITSLGLLARQNRKSGWKRQRPNHLAEALQNFYSDLGVVTEEMAQPASAQLQALTPEEVVSFSEQMLNLRSALGTSHAVTQPEYQTEAELVRER